MQENDDVLLEPIFVYLGSAHGAGQVVVKQMTAMAQELRDTGESRPRIFLSRASHQKREVMQAALLPTGHTLDSEGAPPVLLYKNPKGGMFL